MGIYLSSKSQKAGENLPRLACILKKENPDLVQALPRFIEKIGKYADQPSCNPLCESDDLTKEEKEIMIILLLNPICDMAISDMKEKDNCMHKGCFKLGTFEARSKEMCDESISCDLILGLCGISWNMLLLKRHISIHKIIGLMSELIWDASASIDTKLMQKNQHDPQAGIMPKR